MERFDKWLSTVRSEWKTRCEWDNEKAEQDGVMDLFVYLYVNDFYKIYNSNSSILREAYLFLF